MVTPMELSDLVKRSDMDRHGECGSDARDADAAESAAADKIPLILTVPKIILPLLPLPSVLLICSSSFSC